MNKAIADLIMAAESNNADAQNELYGYISEDDLPEIDKKQIIDWLQRSAKQGNANSMFWISCCYLEGFGFAEDEKSAFDWFLKSADAGNGLAAGSVGEYYKEGKIVTKDYSKAIDYFEKSIEICGEDNVASDEMGGRICDVYKNDLAWWEAVANRKPSVVYPAVPFCVGNYYYLLDDPDLDRAVYFYRIGAEQGYGFSQYVLGKFYYTGEGVEKDPVKAFHWLEKAAQQDVAPAMYYLGMLYADDQSAVFDMEKAISWLKRNAAAGIDGAFSGLVELELSWCYILGVDVEDDDQDLSYWDENEYVFAWVDSATYYLSEAESNLSEREFVDVAEDSWWYRRVKQGDDQALFWMGMCYKNLKWRVPPGGECNDVCALDCLRKAAEKGNVHAQFNLACLLYHGPIQIRDKDEGICWYRLAAEDGHPDAIEHLKEIEAVSDRS